MYIWLYLSSPRWLFWDRSHRSETSPPHHEYLRLELSVAFVLSISVLCSNRSSCTSQRKAIVTISEILPIWHNLTIRGITCRRVLCTSSLLRFFDLMLRCRLIGPNRMLILQRAWPKLREQWRNLDLHAWQASYRTGCQLSQALLPCHTTGWHFESWPSCSQPWCRIMSLSQIARDDTRNANNMSPDTPQWLHLEHAYIWWNMVKLVEAS